MAYFCTGSKAFELAQQRRLRPVIGGLEMTVTEEGGALFQDACGRAVYLPKGQVYHITGTKDGNGYVITYDEDDIMNGTRYLTAEVGCKLV